MKVLPLFGKGTKRGEGRKDDPFPPLRLPVQPELRGKRVRSIMVLKKIPQIRAVIFATLMKMRECFPLPTNRD